MHYTLHQLQVFSKVVELKSITRAAEALHLTQPAVSIQLKNLQGHGELVLGTGSTQRKGLQKNNQQSTLKKLQNVNKPFALKKINGPKWEAKKCVEFINKHVDPFVFS